MIDENYYFAGGDYGVVRGSGLLVGSMIFVIFAMLVIIYRLPVIRGATQTSATVSPIQQELQAGSTDRNWKD